MNDDDATGLPPTGMSDQEELHRWAAMYGEAEPLGETLVDLGSDLVELGLMDPSDLVNPDA